MDAKKLMQFVTQGMEPLAEIKFSQRSKDAIQVAMRRLVLRTEEDVGTNLLPLVLSIYQALPPQISVGQAPLKDGTPNLERVCNLLSKTYSILTMPTAPPPPPPAALPLPAVLPPPLPPEMKIDEIFMAVSALRLYVGLAPALSVPGIMQPGLILSGLTNIGDRIKQIRADNEGGLASRDERLSALRHQLEGAEARNRKLQADVDARNLAIVKLVLG